MTRDLHDVLSGAEDALAGASSGAMGGQTAARLVRSVRRRRGVRLAVRGSVAVVAVGAIGLASYAGLNRSQAPVPAQTPSGSATPTTAAPTPTPTPTPTASPSPSATAQATGVDVLGLGVVPQASAALLAATTPGWAVIEYAPLTIEGTAPAGMLLLASPDGAVYHLADLDPAMPFYVDLVARLRWTAGQSTAMVWVCRSDDASSCGPASLDLLSGTVSPWSGWSEELESLRGWADDGRAVVVRNGQAGVYLRDADGELTVVDASADWANVDPTGTRIAYLNPAGDQFTVVSLTDDVLAYGALGASDCTLMAWADSTHLLASCSPADPTQKSSDILTIDTGSPDVAPTRIGDVVVGGGVGAATTDGAGSVLFGAEPAGSRKGCAQVWRAAGGTLTQVTDIGPMNGTDVIAHPVGTAGGVSWILVDPCADYGPSALDVLSADGSLLTVIPVLDVTDYISTFGVPDYISTIGWVMVASR